MQQTILIFSIFILCLPDFTPVFAANENDEEGLCFITNYSRKEYGASTQNWAIVQDQRGVMYIGNNSGILEYDGGEWRKIYTTNRTTVRSLAVDSDGTIYAGAQGEFGFLKADSAGQMRFVSLVDKIPSQYREFTDVWKTHATKDGIYFQTLTLMFLYNPLTTAIKVIKPKIRFHLSYLIHGRLYVVQKEIGLTRVLADSFQLLPGGELFAKESVMAMIPFSGDWANDPRILICSRNRGLFIFDGNAIIPYKTQADSLLIKSWIYHGTLLPNGHFAIATLYSGIVIIDQNGQLCKILDKSAGLQNQSIRYISVDRQDALWAGLEDGVARVEVTSPFTAYYDNSGLKGKVYSIVRHQGILYVGTNLGLYYLDEKPDLNFTSGYRHEFKPVPGVVAAMCWSLLSAGNSLIVATGEGAYQIQSGKARLISKGITFVIHRSSLDTARIYLGMKEGLCVLRLVNGKWMEEGKTQAAGYEIRTLAEMKDGRLLAGTDYQGLLRITPASGQTETWPVERFGVQQGLPIGGINVFSAADQEMITGRYGIFKTDESGSRFIPVLTFGNTFTDTAVSVILIAEGHNKNVWLCSDQEEKHLIHMNQRQADGSYIPQTTSFLRIHDFKALAVYPEKNGIVWFGGPDGLMRYNPNIKINYTRNFPSLIRRVLVNGDSVIYSGTALTGWISATENEPALIPGPVIHYKDHVIRFEFTAPSFDREKENMFQCFLEGLDEGWSAWTKETKKDYTNIPEGHYRFHVRAKNIYEHPGDESVYEFTILPPWYRAWGAYLFYGVCIILGIWGIVYWRSRRLMHDKQILETLVAQRTADLAQKEQQLEKIDLIVRAINTKIHIDEFLNSLLNEIAFTEKIQNAAVLMYQAQNDTFRFIFTRGWKIDSLSEIELTPAEAESRYAPAACQVVEDIFLINEPASGAGDEKFANLVSSQSMLVLRIQNQDRISGYIIFDRMKDEEPFTESDIQLLSNLRQHILSGFTKAQLVTHLQQANEELKKLSDTKSEFLGIAAHDLRNPLGAIIGFIDLLIQDLKAGQLNIGEAITDLETVLNSARQMVNLISELLDISAIESGKVNIELQRYNLNLIFEECERIHRKHAHQKNIRLVIDKNDNLPDVIIDKSRISEVVDNLLSNAIKYTFPEGHVRLYTEIQPKEIYVHIQDSGQGLSENDLQQIFRSFKKLSARPTGGESSTGFGLAIVKKIVELHHGRVWVESKVNQGSTFSFSIPLPVK